MNARNYLLICLFFFSVPFFAQPPKDWKIKPFVNNCFIENKGQLAAEEAKTGEKLLYAVQKDGMQLFFSKGKLTWKFSKVMEMNEEQKEKAGKGGFKAKKEFEKANRPLYVEMSWQDANPNAEIIVENQLHEYYTYPDPADKTGRSGIKAAAYSKLIYKNIYPGIDIEYIFPEGKEGIKYNIILHSGADPAAVKMKYSNAEVKIENRNLVISTSYGDIIDHAPEALDRSTGEIIPAAFILNKKTAYFQLGKYAKEHETIIDPWVSTTIFPVYNRAYDVNYDRLGNVYIYGGGWASYQLCKYNSSGVLQWSYTHPFTYYHYYGDFCIDSTTGNCYLGEALNQTLGAQVAKVNAGGIQTGLFTGGGSALAEIWRIEYSQCNAKLILGGGGTLGVNQAATLDTNLTGFAAYNMLLPITDCCDDISIMALDNYGNSYFGIPTTPVYTTHHGLYKCAITSLGTPTYSAFNYTPFNELANAPYTYGGIATGFNGMAVSSRYLYTYDGAVLKKWNTNTGTLLDTVIVGPTPLVSGGISVDACENIYIGSYNTLKLYDSLLALKATIPLTDTVYDVRANVNNLVYTCGKGFVSSLKITTVSDCSCRNSCDSPEPCNDSSIVINPPPPPPPPPSVDPVLQLMIPNVFSPNGDGKNDLFNITATGYSNYRLEIYNRWGTLIFSSDDPALQWNGKISNSGAAAPDGTYYYILRLSDPRTGPETHTGFLTLLR